MTFIKSKLPAMEKFPQENTEWGVKPMRYYLEGVVFGVICILLIKLLLSI